MKIMNKVKALAVGLAVAAGMLIAPAAQAQGTCNSVTLPCYSPPSGACFENMPTNNIAIDVSFVGSYARIGGRLQPNTTYCSSANPYAVGSAINGISIGQGYCVKATQFTRFQNHPFGLMRDVKEYSGWVGQWAPLTVGYSYVLNARHCAAPV